jgi:hypothetical protein
MTMTADFPSQDPPPARTSRNTSVWRKLFAVVTDGPTPTAEDVIAAYLHCHQNDVPPALWIELERRRLMP